MVRTLSILLMIICCTNPLSAQSQLTKSNIYKAWVRLEGADRPISGALFAARDSAIHISGSFNPSFYSSHPHPDSILTRKIPVNTIHHIKLRSSNAMGKGAAIGAACGFLLGMLAGLAMGDDPPCSSGTFICIRFTAAQKGLMLGLPLAVVGTGLGIAFGSIKINISINLNQQNYDVARSRLAACSIMEGLD